MLNVLITSSRAGSSPNAARCARIAPNGFFRSIEDPALNTHSVTNAPAGSPNDARSSAAGAGSATGCISTCTSGPPARRIASAANGLGAQMSWTKRYATSQLGGSAGTSHAQ